MATIRLIAATLVLGFIVGCATAPTEYGSAESTASTHTRCLQSAAWYRLNTGHAVAQTAAQLLGWAQRQDVVLLGETHTSADDHRWQLQTLAVLHALHPNMVIGFESFPRRLQPVLDQWVAGKLGVDEFLDRVEWHKVWDYPAKYYLPLFQFARMHRIPMDAINVDLDLPRAVRKQGWDAVPASAKEGVSRPAKPAQAYVDMLYDVFKQHAFTEDGNTVDKQAPRFRHFVQAQATWDRAMAQALAARVKVDGQSPAPLVVGIMGAGHMRHGHGVPYQLRALGIGAVAVLLTATAERGCQPFAPDFADAVFVLPNYPGNEPPRLGVQLMSVNKTIAVADVQTDSVAAAAGFEPGDQIVAIDGSPVQSVAAVVDAIATQPPDTPMSITIRRGDETLRLTVEFPAAR